jgi:hypothetical protein
MVQGSMSRKGKSIERGMERGVNAAESVITMEPVRLKRGRQGASVDWKINRVRLCSHGK